MGLGLLAPACLLARFTTNAGLDNAGGFAGAGGDSASSHAGTPGEGGGPASFGGSNAHGGNAGLNGDAGALGGRAGSSSGGASSGGANSSGANSGGSSNGGGSGGADPTVIKSSGCGKAPPVGIGADGWANSGLALQGTTLTNTMAAPDVERSYSMNPPPNYDRNRAYSAVFLISACDAPGSVYEMETVDRDAFYFKLWPRTVNPPGCYDIDSGPSSSEWEYFAATVALMEADFCLDKSRIYVAGFAEAATLAKMYGCYFGGTKSGRKLGADISVRGMFAVGGKTLPAGVAQYCSSNPMAAALIHDQNDLTDPEDPTTLAQIVNANSCSGAKTWAPANMPTQLANHCTIYSGCPTVYPLVHCETANLGHVPQDTDANFVFTQLVGMLKSK